jgi:hypothetical protein
MNLSNSINAVAILVIAATTTTIMSIPQPNNQHSSRTLDIYNVAESI